MKKSVLILVSLFIILGLSALVSAVSLPAPPIVWSDVTLFLNNLLVGATTIGSDDTFARFLILVLLIVILTKPAKTIIGSTTPAIIIATIVSILGLRFLSAQLIQGILLPYGTVAIVASTFIPFALLAYFLSDISIGWIRKIGWIFTTVIFVGLWWMRWTDIGNMAYAYIIASILSIAFFFFDGTIQGWLKLNKIQKEKSKGAYMRIMELKQSIDEAIALFPNATTTAEKSVLRESIKEDEDKIKELMKQL